MDTARTHDPRTAQASNVAVLHDLRPAAPKPATAARDPRKAKLEANKLAKKLRRQVGEAIADYAMIEEGDRVMVCLSGGKDSYVMLDILRNLQAAAPVDFELHAVNLDQKQPGFPERVLPGYLDSIGVLDERDDLGYALSGRWRPPVERLLKQRHFIYAEG